MSSPPTRDATTVNVQDRRLVACCRACTSTRRPKPSANQTRQPDRQQPNRQQPNRQQPGHHQPTWRPSTTNSQTTATATHQPRPGQPATRRSGSRRRRARPRRRTRSAGGPAPTRTSDQWKVTDMSGHRQLQHHPTSATTGRPRLGHDLGGRRYCHVFPGGGDGLCRRRSGPDPYRLRVPLTWPRSRRRGRAGRTAGGLRQARWVTDRMRVLLTSCRIVYWNALVEVSARITR